MTLDSAHAETLPVRYTGAYSLMEIPPRCRKPRPVRHQADFTLPVRSVTGPQAPVAMTYTTTTSPDATVVLRFFDGHLYRTATHTAWPRTPDGSRGNPVQVAIEYGSEGFRAEASLNTSDWHTVDSLEAVIAAHAERLTRYLIVDGVVWEHADEPRYVVDGAPFAVRWTHDRGPWIQIKVTDTDNANDDPRHIFRADQHTAALADALAMAREVGVDDDKIAELADADAPITVHLPASVQLVVPEQEHQGLRELRDALQSALRGAAGALGAVDKRYADPVHDPERALDFADAWTKLTGLHEQILTLTDDVVGAEAVRRPYMPAGLEVA